MKKEISARPGTIGEQFLKDAGGFAWEDFVTAIPTPHFVVTGWKSNGKENASLQAWSTFFGSDTGDFICIIGKVFSSGHMYRSLKETGVCVLNFPAPGALGSCVKTIYNNQFEVDEISASGLTVEKAYKVNAPRIKECFLNIECEYLWEHEHCAGSQELAVALKAVHICMDDAYYDQQKTGRYGKTGYTYCIHMPHNPDNGEWGGQGVIGTIEETPFEWPQR